MVNDLKEIRDRLNLLVQEVERLESFLSQGELIIEKNDFKYLKEKGKLNSYRHVFEFLNGVFFELPDTPGSSNTYSYEFSIYKGLLSGDLEKLVLLKLEKEYTHEGFLITHKVEDRVNAKLREKYRGK